MQDPAQNQPNPFNSGTIIPFDLREESDWTLSVYNVAGQVVRRLFGHDVAGRVSIQWDGSDR